MLSGKSKSKATPATYEFEFNWCKTQVSRLADQQVNVLMKLAGLSSMLHMLPSEKMIHEAALIQT